jgi:hypothetical protein
MANENFCNQKTIMLIGIITSFELFRRVATCIGVWQHVLVCGNMYCCVASCIGVWQHVLVCGIMYWCVASCIGVWHHVFFSLQM